jgi:hypothetical protein
MAAEPFSLRRLRFQWDSLAWTTECPSGLAGSLRKLTSMTRMPELTAMLTPSVSGAEGNAQLLLIVTS